jgi:hypothetical protein
MGDATTKRYTIENVKVVKPSFSIIFNGSPIENFLSRDLTFVESY